MYLEIWFFLVLCGPGRVHVSMEDIDIEIYPFSKPSTIHNLRDPQNIITSPTQSL